MERDLLAERIAERQRRARERADALRAKLPRAAALLRDRGATRVVLFGSLATGRSLHEESDVDLAVWGFPDVGYFATLADLADLFGADVDLVEMEKASPSMVQTVTEDGVEVALDGTG